MYSNDISIDGLFKDTISYRVPLYQRYYVWNEVNWEHLWDDIQTKSELRFYDQKSAKTHFTGAIVTQSEAKNLQEIIDGQQRLTTFQIILCAIRDIFKTFRDDKTKETAKKAESYILNNPSRVEKDQMYKLLPREGPDRNTFQFLVLSEIEKAKDSDKHGHIYGAYKYFRNKIETYVMENYRKISTLYDTILQDFKVVQIKLESGDEYARIFESINGRGQHLNQFDLLRHDLFLRAGIGDERDRLYEDYWILFEEAEGFWRDPKVAEDFLEYFIKLKKEEDLDDQLTLYDQYQQYYKNLTEEFDPDETDSQIKYEFFDLSRYADSYQKIKDPNSDSGICEQVQFYNVLKIDDLLLPLILYIMSEFRLSDSELENVLLHLESYTVRSLIGENEQHPEFYFRIRLEKKIKSFFNDKKSFSLVNFMYLFSDEWSADQLVKSAMKQDLDAEQKPEWKLGLLPSYMRTPILDRIENNSGEFEDLEFFNRFCEIWPSAETMLQSGLEGALPIIHSKSLSSIEVKPRLEPYKFMTYDGIRESSKYEVCEDKIVGTNINGDGSAENVLEIEEILFAFPTTAMSDLELQLNNLNEDVKDQGLTQVQKPDPSQFKNWLWLCAELTGNLYSKHRFLPNIYATIVTRTGHVLQGTLKSFNDDAIYMQINGQVVPVYMHGLYKLCMHRTVPLEYFVMTDDGAKSISKPELYRDKVIGTTPHSDSNEEIELSMDNVHFIHQNANLNQEDILSDLQDKKVSRVDDELLESAKLRQTQAQVVTITQSVLQGYIRDYDEGSIYMQTEEGLVILHRRCIHSFKEIMETSETSEPSETEVLETLEPSKKQQWRSMVESRKQGSFKFVTFDDKVIQLSEIETDHNTVTGIPIGHYKRFSLDKQDILFAYGVNAVKIVEPFDFWNDVEENMLDESNVTNVIIQSKYVLRGRQVGFDDETIHLQIRSNEDKATVIVFKHGLSQEASLEDDQHKDTKITGHIQSIANNVAFVEIGKNVDRDALKEGVEVEVIVVQSDEPTQHVSWDNWVTTVESLQNCMFITHNSKKPRISLSQIKVHNNIVHGVNSGSEEVTLDSEQVISFVCSLEAWNNFLRSHILKLTSLDPQEVEKLQVDDMTLERAIGYEVIVITLSRYSLKGTMEYFDKDVIYMKIKEQTVIVFRHDLYNFKIDEDEPN